MHGHLAPAHISVMTNTSDTVIKSQCRGCNRRRVVYSCQRYSGGNYRIAPRWRASSICAECAVTALANVTIGQNAATWSAEGVAKVVETLDSDEARAALTSYRAKKEIAAAASIDHDRKTKAYGVRVRERNALFEWMKAQTGRSDIEPWAVGSIVREAKSSRACGERASQRYLDDGTVIYDIPIVDLVVGVLDAIAADLATEHLSATARTLAADLRAGKYLNTISEDQ